MSFSFMRSTSHRPDDEHLDEEEEDDATGQMPVRTSGGVRAFSHLPVKQKPWQDAEALQELLGGDGRERPFMPPEPVNKPYFGPSESVNKPAFGPSKPDYDVYVKPPGHRPADDYDLYRKPPNHRREDDYDFYKKKKPNPLLDYLQHLDENEDADELRPPARSGMVRAFSHLPERKKKEDSDADIDAEQDDAASHEDFKASVPDSENGSRHPDEPPSPIGAPPMAQSRLLEQRQMPPGWQAGSRDGGARAGTYAQNVAAPGGAVRNETAVRAQAPAQGAGPQQPGSGGGAPKQAAAPAQPPAQGSPAAPVPPPALQVDPENESAEFELTDQATEKKHKSPLTFGDHVRTIMRHEIENSPTARRLLEYVQGQSSKPISIKMAQPGVQSHPRIGLDGSITLFINPDTLRSGTLSHEIVHQIQTLALKQASRPVKDPKTGQMVTPKFDEAKTQANSILNGLAPVIYDGKSVGNGNPNTIGDGNDSGENEAMRAVNIVIAELDAAKIRAELDELKKTDPARYALESTPAKIIAKFWEGRQDREKSVHQHSQKQGLNTGLPVGTRYGNYDFKNVNEILGLTGNEKVRMPAR